MKPALLFDRHLAYSKRLDISARSAVHFKPGNTQTITLVGIRRKKYISGGNDLACEIEKYYTVYGDEVVADIDIKSDHIASIDKASNPDVINGLTSNMVIVPL
ncbi:urease [Gigaspora margarita]|uniref:Urease n=1 Tax=Gigaspora margarita TaxID=4874 RepID=A0A8H3X6G1_GIGMA|nr:urease [Gigaspora margarita]